MINSMEDKYSGALKYINRPNPIAAFERYYLQSALHFAEVEARIKSCSLQDTGCRFNIWRLCLGVNKVESEWEAKKQQLETQRKRFHELKEQARTGIKLSSTSSPAVAPLPVSRNPLMKGPIKQQEKKETESDEFLKEEIKKDVERTYQQLAFFQQKSILKLLESILFIWCKLNPDVSYKQGINELLASIVYVYFQECSNSVHSAQQEQVLDMYAFSNGIAYCEADIYSIFERVMVLQKEMYKTEADSQKKGLVNPNSKNNTPILQRIIQIQDHRLKALDLELFRIMKLQDVKTKSFLLRWIRCMHTRQFSLEESFYIWDCIFLDYYQSPLSRKKNQFEFIDAMCLAMFIYMRSIVLTRETSNEILQIYSKYPVLKKGEYLEELVKLAWAVCDELRAQAQGQQQANNWYEEGDKHGKLGLMEKGGYANTVKNQKKKNQEDQQEYELNKNEDKHQKNEKNGQKAQKAQKPIPSVQSAQIFPKKTSETAKSQAQSPKKQVQIKSVPVTVSPPITFTVEQVKKLISNLSKSISLNDDIESRALSNQVLKVLQGKISTSTAASE